MRKFIFLLPALLVLLSCQKADSQDLPDRNKVLALMELANSHFMRTWPDVAQESFVRNRYRPSHIWTRGVYYEGLMALHQICPREIGRAHV